MEQRPSNAELRDLLNLHTTVDAVAKALGLPRATVRDWYVEAKKSRTAEILDEHGLDGVTVTGGSVGKYGVSLRFKPEPEFPLIQPATPTKILFTPSTAPYIAKKVRYAAVISDAQIGFLRDLDTHQLEPIHDPDAMDVAKQIVADVRPAELDFIGDWMDWTTFTRWQKHPEYQRVVQPSIEAGYQELGSFISAAGPQCAKRMMIGSNHGARPEKFINEHNMDAVGLRRANSPTSWPVFSEPFLLRYDELGIQMSGQYPADEYYLLPDLVLTHARPKNFEFQASIIHGHTHHLTRTTHVQHGYAGRQTFFIYDVGCLCQVGTADNRRRLMLLKVPSDRARSNWAQGIAIVSIIDGKIPKHSVEQISILNGEAIYQGTQYTARHNGTHKAAA